MNRHYQSDLDDDEPVDEPGMWMRLAIIVVYCLMGLALALVVTYAEDTGEGRCIPTGRMEAL